MSSSLLAAEAKKSSNHYHFVDVREAHEFAAGHIPHAVHVPLSVLAAGGDVPLPPEKPYVIYCQAGVRSSKAIEILRQRGFIQLTNLSDGYAGWVQA